MTVSAPDARRALRLLQAASFTSSFDRMMVAPMLVLIAVDLGDSVESVSHAVAAYFLCYGIAQVGWAMVSDRLGRVRTMRLAWALSAVSGLASAVVTDVGWLVVARGFAGACFAAAVPGSLVYIGDTVPVQVRQAPLTDLMTSNALGITLATMAAGAIADFASWRVAFALTGTVAVVLTVVMRKLPEPASVDSPPVLASLRAVLASKWALLVLLLALLEGFVLVGPLTFLPATLQAGGLSVTVAGLLTAFYGATVLFTARVVKRLTRRTAPATLILVGGCLAVVAYVLLTVDQGTAPVILGAIMLGGGWAFMHSTMQTWATDVAPAARATAVSLFATMLFTGSAVGAAIAGPWADDGRFQLMFAVALAVSVPLTLVATLGRRRYSLSGADGRPSAPAS